MKPVIIFILMMVPAVFIAYLLRKNFPRRWHDMLLLCFVAGCGLISLIPPMPDYMEPFIFGFIGIAYLFAEKFTGLLLLKKILREHPGLVDGKGCFTHKGIAYSRASGIGAPPSLAAYFTIDYPDGSSRRYPARFYIRRGRLTKAGFKKIPPAPYKTPEEDPSRENIREWKRYNGRLYCITNYQKDAP